MIGYDLKARWSSKLIARREAECKASEYHLGPGCKVRRNPNPLVSRLSDGSLLPNSLAQQGPTAFSSKLNSLQALELLSRLLATPCEALGTEIWV